MSADKSNHRNLIGDRLKLARERAKPKVTQTDLLARLAVRGLELEKTTISKIEAKTCNRYRISGTC